MGTSGGLVKEISSLTPAQDWYAVYALEGKPELTTDRLACFGVVRLEHWTGTDWENAKSDMVIGFVAGDGGLSSAEDAVNFLGYYHWLYPASPMPEVDWQRWLVEREDYLKRQKERIQRNLKSNRVEHEKLFAG